MIQYSCFGSRKKCLFGILDNGERGYLNICLSCFNIHTTSARLTLSLCPPNLFRSTTGFNQKKKKNVGGTQLVLGVISKILTLNVYVMTLGIIKDNVYDMMFMKESSMWCPWVPWYIFWYLSRIF